MQHPKWQLEFEMRQVVGKEGTMVGIGEEEEEVEEEEKDVCKTSWILAVLTAEK